ncbi:efflux transporter periplasmic adaptor subunit [Siphonobacter sp. BAB-5385]|uniref:efflux RND transporter periplasmic adaptor subunit n=1 Tax=unclassified Siphonobacter TaxID=2635712 RepID=UPI000B9E8800|nr:MULTISPECIES: efflux RND transporter periplasmic adaptor subunit [unclassified Siphonobacter]OZI07509.1 efflux transporter periplasmic adaptor subunit [Siphonobacter sp. BAB-5385]PMD98411.1 efflux transporter periplasmic adaptor subunit [Siphonobacter sp. BAB-5405]
MKRSSNRIWWILGVVVILLFGGLFIAKSAGWIGKEKAEEATFSVVKAADIVERVSASGKVQPEVEIKISPDVSGEIIELKIHEGDSVVKGQLLLRIRPDNYESLVARAKAALNQSKASYEQTKSALGQVDAQLIRAQADYNRNKKLYADKVISDADFETVEANYKVARQNVESARANIEAARFAVESADAGLRDANETLRKTTIYAPSNGIISKLDVELGERVVGTSQMAGTEMLRIANLNNMEVRVNVNENDIVRVNVGDSVIIDVDAYSYSGRKFKGLVTSIANTANGSGSLSAAASSTDAVTEFEVKIRILPESYLDLVDRKNKRSFPFRPGMTASVEVVTDRKNGVLSVPIASVTTRSEEKETATADPQSQKPRAEARPQEVVFIHKNGVVEMRPVKTGISDFENIEILSGLKAGEEVVSGPFTLVSKTLKAGDKVMKKVEKEKK